MKKYEELDRYRYDFLKFLKEKEDLEKIEKEKQINKKGGE